MMTELLGRVEYSNLLTINWNEQKIQTNFKLIVDAISQQQTDSSGLKEQFERVKEELARLTERINQLPKHQSDKDQSRPITPINETEIGAGLAGAALTGLRNQIQKKLDEDRNRLNQEYKDLKNQIESLRKEFNNKSSKEPSMQILPSVQPDSVRSSKNHTETKIDTKHQQCMNKDEANRKIQELFELIDKVKEDQININAKLNIHQQKLDSQRKLRSSIAPIDKNLAVLSPNTNNNINNKLGSANKVEGQQCGSIRSKMTKNSISIKDVANQQNKPHEADLVVNSLQHMQDLSNMESQISGILIDMGTLRLCYEQLKLMQGELKKNDDKQFVKQEDLSERQENFKQRLDIDRDHVDKQLKNLKISLAQLSMLEKEADSNNLIKEFGQTGTITPTQTTQRIKDQPIKGSTKTINQVNTNRRDHESKDRVNDKITMLQSLLLESVNRTDFDRFKGEIMEQLQLVTTQLQRKMTDMNKIMEASDARIEELDERFKSENQKLYDQLQQAMSMIKTKLTELEKKQNVTNSKCDEMRKDIQYVKEDLEYYKNNLIKTESGGSGISSISGKVDEDGRTDKGALDAVRKRMDEMKKQYTNKMHDLRSEMMNAIRDFERRMSNKGNMDQQIGLLQQKMQEIKLYLSRKADVEDTKKSLVYLDKKLSVLTASLNRDDDAVEDARAAKKNWFCLSCDKVLEGYSGKVGKHIPWNALTTKNLSKTIQVQNISKMEDNKRKDPLPTLSYSVKK